MTHLFNDPHDFAAEALRGFAAAYPRHVTEVHGGAVRATLTPKGQPALVVGGGTGHYPAFAGWIGPGLAHGAPCGNIFSSPSASQVYSVARNADNGGGVILGFGNYAGDVLHFGVAAEKLRAEGIDVRVVPVSDDIASGKPDEHRRRRGVAGDLPVFKIAGAAIQAGADLDEAERIAWKANDATRSFGIAFAGCTLPGADEPLFTVEEGTMALGLGIHGEQGVQDVPLGTAAEIAELLVAKVLAERDRAVEVLDAPAESQDTRAAVLVNGLGSVKYEELFVVWATAAAKLAEAGITIVEPEVGEFVSSLDMAGLSLTLTFLDDELEKYWIAPCDTPAFRRGTLGHEAEPRTTILTSEDESIPESTAESRESASALLGVLEAFAALATEKEAELGKLDSVAGDGDHGQGMQFGTKGAVEAARLAFDRGAGARTLLVRAGAAWAETAGGTSGALWGAALTSAGGQLSDDAGHDDASAVAALLAATGAVQRLGGARVGDKTMVDALVPFETALEGSFDGANLGQAVAAAARAATEAADSTKDLTAQLGRARVLGAKSLGTPDPGAISFALLMTELAGILTPTKED